MKGLDVQPALFIEFCRIGDDFLSAQRFMMIPFIPESSTRVALKLWALIYQEENGDKDLLEGLGESCFWMLLGNALDTLSAMFLRSNAVDLPSVEMPQHFGQGILHVSAVELDH